MQIAAIQSAASERPVSLAPTWLRLIAGAWLALLFALMAFRDESALALGERDVSPASVLLVQLARSVAFGLVGPIIVRLLAQRRGVHIRRSFGSRWDIPSSSRFSHLQRSLGSDQSAIEHLFRRLYRTAGRYLPPARLVTLARSGFADPLEGQEREVSILLVDLAGFTSFSNRPDLTASEIVRVANRYFTLMQAAIDRHDGCSDKFLGDAVLAFWNGLSDEPDHALKALATASEIISAVGHAEESETISSLPEPLSAPGKSMSAISAPSREATSRSSVRRSTRRFASKKSPDAVRAFVAGCGLDGRNDLGFELVRNRLACSRSNVLVRIDDVELKGFDGCGRSIRWCPEMIPGLPTSRRGAKLLTGKWLARRWPISRPSIAECCGWRRRRFCVRSIPSRCARTRAVVASPRPGCSGRATLSPESGVIRQSALGYELHVAGRVRLRFIYGVVLNMEPGGVS